MGWIGFNCSIPTRSRRSTILDGLGESAALIGAVNCFVRRREKAIGENTEGRGFVTALRSFVDPSGCKIACNNDPLRGGFRVQ
jgi:shikimate dehydrogenase